MIKLSFLVIIRFVVTIGNYVVKYSNNYLLNNNIIIIDYIYFVLGVCLSSVGILDNFKRTNIKFFMTKKLRKLFPFFTHHKDLIYLDSAGTSLKPNTVIQAISNYYEKYSINSHSEGGNPLFNET